MYKGKFGNAMEKFNIEVGVVYKSKIGSLLCGDVEAGDLHKLMAGTKADAVFTDPPWTTAVAKQFRTYAGVPREVDFDQLIKTAVDEFKKYSRNILYIEMGKKGFPVLEGALALAGAKVSCIYEGSYGAGTKHVIWFGSWDGDIDEPTPPLGLTGWDIAEWFGEWSKDNYGITSILDPFVGAGGYLKVAKKLGLYTYGMELSARKLANCFK